MRAIEVTLRNPYLVIVLVLATLVVGIRSMLEVPADLLPQFDTPAMQIVCFYPGMPPEVMERDIMSRLERWTGQSVGISHQEAKAMLGVCVVKDHFREGITMDTARSFLLPANARLWPWFPRVAAIIPPAESARRKSPQ